MLDNIITSKARQKVLTYLYSGGVEFTPFVRQIVRGTKLEINAVRRELNKLSKVKLIKEEPRGNRLHYSLNMEHPLYYELAQVISKEVGLGSIIYKKRRRIGNIKFALLSLNFFLKTKIEGSVDLLIVGDVYIKTLKDIIDKYQKDKSREVNYMVLSSEEFRILKDRRDSLLMSSLFQPRSILIGAQEKFLSS